MADDYEDMSIEQLQRRVEQLRSLAERINNDRLDISDRPLLLELLGNTIEEAERGELPPELVDLVMVSPSLTKQGVEGEAAPPKTSPKPRG